MENGEVIKCIANNSSNPAGNVCIGHLFTVEVDSGDYIIASYWGDDPLLEWADYIFERSEIEKVWG